MKFTKLIAILAVSTLAASASANDDGTLRRTEVAQNDTTTVDAKKEVNININTQAQQQAVQQPVTTVEAAPVAVSKAEQLRKTRQDAEIQTEQKIVEKLEDSRLQEERARADRLFGNKLDADKPAAVVVVAPTPAPAPIAPAPVVQEKPAGPAQVTIEKVEIIQPKPEPVAESKIDAKSEMAPPSTSKFYIGGLLGNLSYSASNVKSNYGLGVAVGTIIDDKWGVEISYMYSNHNVDDIWPGSPLFHRLDQNDFGGAAKYYILGGKLKPYVGGSLTYINRKYTDRIYGCPNCTIGNYNGYGNTSNSTSTSAINAGLLGGVDFALSDTFMLGAGADYNFNVMNLSDFDQRAYNLPSGFEPLEKISYWTLKVTAKVVF